MRKSLYFECYSGISGDMTVAALLDLGADRTVLEKVLSSLPLPGFKIKTGRVLKSGIDACDFDVVLDRITMTMIWHISTDMRIRSIHIIKHIPTVITDIRTFTGE